LFEKLVPYAEECSKERIEHMKDGIDRETEELCGFSYLLESEIEKFAVRFNLVNIPNLVSCKRIFIIGEDGYQVLRRISGAEIYEFQNGCSTKDRKELFKSLENDLRGGSRDSSLIISQWSLADSVLKLSQNGLI
jgi:hypothetical protein